MKRARITNSYIMIRNAEKTREILRKREAALNNKIAALDAILAELNSHATNIRKLLDTNPAL